MLLKRFSCFILFLCLSNSAFATLNLSTKPSEITVYLPQNIPYSGFNSAQQPVGLYVQYWQLWSLATDIDIKFSRYQEQDVDVFLSENSGVLYSTLNSPQSSSASINKSVSFAINSTFYYLLSSSDKVVNALDSEKKRIIVGGLFPQAQQLPFFMDKGNIIYQQYPGLLEIILDLYSHKIDALVLFNIGSGGDDLIDNLLAKFLQPRVIDSTYNQLVTYLSADQHILFEWLQWGNQFEQIEVGMRSALTASNAPWWGLSRLMISMFLVVISLFIVVVFFMRSKHNKQQKITDLLDYSSYPVVLVTLDGHSILYMNEEVNTLIPFKKSLKKSIFEEDENKLLFSECIRRASQETVIVNERVRLLSDGISYDIEIAAKQIDYRRQSVWLCYLKDISALLRAEEKLVEERSLLSKVLESLPEEIAVKSAKGIILSCNNAWANVHNTTVEEATGRNMLDSMGIDAIKKQKQQEAMAWKGQVFNCQEWIADKKTFDFRLINMSKKPLYNDPETVFAILTVDSDITDHHNLSEQLKDEISHRKKAEISLSKLRILFNAVLDASNDSIGLLDADGRIIGVNKTFATLINSAPENLIGKLQNELLPEVRATWVEHINHQVMTTGKPISFEKSLFNGTKKSRYKVRKTAFKNRENISQGIVIVAQEMSTTRITEEKLILDVFNLESQVLHDPMTKIANRHAFDVRLSELWQETQNEQEMLSLLFCNVDYLESYNDNYGRQKGDKVLQVLASILLSATQKMGGFVARYEGKEFAIMFKGGNATKALRVAEKLREAVNHRQVEHLYSDISKHITMSVGLASIFPSDLNAIKVLVAEAKFALNDAQKSGRDQVRVHD